MAAKKKSAKKKQCDCIDKMNTALKPKNCELDILYFLMQGKCVAQIALRQLETGKGKLKAPKLAASYCPFCGKKYP